jgi:histone acetyltransferase (RNA polymerase elongator complex component)
VFCNQRVISGAVNAAGAGDVRAAVDTARELIVDGEGAEIAFYGGSFTAIPEAEQIELLEAAQPFLALGSKNAIRVSTRPDCLDGTTVARLKSYGVATVELGAQSMCDDVLLMSRRGHTAFDVARAAGIIKGAGLKLVLQMMTGLPGDSREKSLFTAKRFIELAPDGVRIYPTVVVRGTELYNMWRRGQYNEHTVDYAADLCAEICLLFEKAAIPIIRLGLNPNEDLSAGSAVAGAYHPAFGELVYSKVYYNKAAHLLREIQPGSAVTIGVARGRVSMMTGHKRCNTVALMREYSLRSLKVVETDATPGEMVIKCVMHN